MVREELLKSTSANQSETPQSPFRVSSFSLFLSNCVLGKGRLSQDRKEVVLIAFLFTVAKYLTKTSLRRAFLGSQFKGTVPDGGKHSVAGA